LRGWWTVAAVMALVIAAVASLVVASESGDDLGPPAVPPPTAPSQDPPDMGSDAVAIPGGFLRLEDEARGPVEDPEVRWVRDEGYALPPLVSACGVRQASDGARVGGRQLVLIGPTLWKAERLVVYRSVRLARRAMSERRAALRACGRHREGGGTTTEWRWSPLPIGDDAMFVGSQRYRSGKAVPGSHRGVVMRRGRVVVMYVDFGPRTTPSRPADVASYQRHARVMARKLGSAPWARARARARFR
jgi:hypothetical protein